MNYHTALVVSLRSVSICIIDDEGIIQFESKLPSEVEEIDKCLRRFNPEITSVGFEAGALTQYLTYGLQAAGYEVICLRARQVNAALSAMRNKTDKTMPVVLHRSCAPAGTAGCMSKVWKVISFGPCSRVVKRS